MRCSHCQLDFPLSALKEVRLSESGGDSGLLSESDSEVFSQGGTRGLELRSRSPYPPLTPQTPDDALQGSFTLSRSLQTDFKNSGRDLVNTSCDDKESISESSLDSEANAPNANSLYFCCHGCESVYFLLHDMNLESFYDKLSSPLSPIDTQALKENLARFDTSAFAQKYIAQDKKNPALSQVHLIISGIHCAACIWLNEKLLLSQEGIYSVNINYTNNKATIVWDKAALPLSSIIALIRKVGYDAYPYDSKIAESAHKAELRDYYIRVIVALFCTMNIMWVAVAQYSGYFLGIDSGAKDILNLASFFLCSLCLFYPGWVFYRSSYYGLKNGFIGMDMLVCVGSSLTYGYSIYAALFRSGETYFESVSMIITFVLFGKFLEVRARKYAGDSLDKLSNLLPSSVELCQSDDWSKSVLISPEEVCVGDVILVRAGDKIALDGELLSPSATFDTKAMSGEAYPLEVREGAAVLSGYINLGGTIFYRVSKAYSESMMSHIIHIVSSALGHKPHIQNLANSLSQHFSRVILSLALLCFMGWYFVGGVGVEHSLMIAISVIIIACPCALALATPIASVVGIAQSTKSQILFKEARFLETLAKATLVVFDKTGTLTEGKPRVVRSYLLDSESKLDSENPQARNASSDKASPYRHEINSQASAKHEATLKASSGDWGVPRGDKGSDFAIQAPLSPLGESRDDLKYGRDSVSTLCDDLNGYDTHLLYSFVRLSKHPVAGGVAEFLSIKVGDTQPLFLEDFIEHSARGISARYGELTLYGGSIAFLQESGFEIPQDVLETLGAGLVFAYGVKCVKSQTDSESSESTLSESVLCEIFELRDEAKQGAKALIDMLHKSGKATALLSGDRLEGVKSVAQSVGISTFYAALTPLQKAEWIEDCKTQNPAAIVVMVGDGINDALALSKSDVSISMGAGSDIAILSSDIVVLDDELPSLSYAFSLAQQTYRTIRQNIALSIGYNALSIPLAMAGLVIPLFAALSMSLSSLIVVLNSLRLKRHKSG